MVNNLSSMICREVLSKCNFFTLKFPKKFSVDQEKWKNLFRDESSHKITVIGEFIISYQRCMVATNSENQ